MRAGVCALWTLALLGAAAPLAVTAPAWLDARARARRELAFVPEAARDARLIAELRLALPPHAEHDAAPLARRVGVALAAAGLPAAALSDLSPESNLRSAGVVGRRATLTLTGVTLPELGRFLAAWRDAEPAWTVTAADLTPESSRTTPPGGDRPLRAVLTLETLFAAETQR
ncbi:MAG: hypothetical protein KIS87_04380 [Phycisphaeraceae bacterium]|nr:hypothetical protein [Phycisphaeraceae bacterium]